MDIWGVVHADVGTPTAVYDSLQFSNNQDGKLTLHPKRHIHLAYVYYCRFKLYSLDGGQMQLVDMYALESVILVHCLYYLSRNYD